jgi:predicted dehydrogenase
MQTIRWGIIGVGDVTEVKSGPALQKADRSELVAVMRRNGDLARDYAARHGVPRWYDDADALIADPDVDAVYIATPPHVHHDYVLRVAAAGKSVYVEKPMARTYRECQEMIAACEDAGVPLFVAYYRRALRRFLKVKELIEEDAIGTVRAVSLTLHQPPPADLDPAALSWRFVPEIAGGGLLFDLGSHMLDLLDFLLGPVQAVHGIAANQAGLYPAEDMVSGAFEFESGVQAAANWCFTTAESIDRIEIIGTAGRITFAAFASKPVMFFTPGRSTTFRIDQPLHVQQPLIQQVVDALTGTGTCSSTGYSAARTNWVLDQLVADYRRQTGTLMAEAGL